jgi:glutamate-ammonia-ligase adenylyltransferase
MFTLFWIPVLGDPRSRVNSGELWGYTALVVDALDRIIDSLQAPARGEAPLDGLGELRPLVEVLLAGPAPRESLLNLRKLVLAAGAAGWPIEGKGLRAVASVLSSGPELTRLLARRPERLALLLDPQLGRLFSTVELREALRRAISGASEVEAFAERLVAFRNDHYVRLAACEFGAASLEQVGLELSNLADVCLDHAMAFAVDTLAQVHGPPLGLDGGEPRPCGLVAMAMGKYGAQELNFCSDIDVIFLYRTDEGSAGALTLHEFFARVCQLATRLLSDPTPEGIAFRVDLRLRPEGSRGPICNAIAGAERYYETWGGPYDRLAWLKARPAAGDLALGEHMLRFLRPFVFPRHIRPEVVQQIQELNRRIKAQTPAGPVAGWNVKLEGGGIREVEFFIQALQLLHAGKQEVLQERGSLRALDKLLFAGLISEQEHRQLGEAYELWRRIEHRLQLHDGRQTHLLPSEGALRQQVALHLGFAPESFRREIEERRAQVSAVYATLGSTPADEATPLAPLLDPELPRDAAVEILGRAGFAQVERALDEIALLAAKPWGPLARAHTGGGASRLSLPFLAEIARSPDPDAALLHFVELVLRMGPYEGIWALLDQNRPLLRLVCSLFGTSDYLARLFIRHPELLDGLFLEGRARPRRGREDMRADLEAQLDATPADDMEARLNRLARFRNEEVLRIGLADIAGDLDLPEVWEQLSDLAEVILEQIYPLVLAETQARYGTPRGGDGRPAVMAVIGLGKLGGRELTYASDLDLIFVYSDSGVTDGPRSVDHQEFFARVVQRLIRALSSALEEGNLYQVDTRLRPSGKQGTLVTSWSAFREYHASAQTWERQVLIKARAVGGEPDLGRTVEQWVQSFLYASPASGDCLRHDIHRLRQRMEKELAAESGDFYNLKLGRGGLLDVDFIVQYIQLCHGHGAARLRARSTLDVLDALTGAGLLDSGTASSLTQGYRFLRRIESRLRIVRDRSAEHLPRGAEGLEVMARRLGYRQQEGLRAGDRLLADYREQTEIIRRIYGRILGGDP